MEAKVISESYTIFVFSSLRLGEIKLYNHFPLTSRDSLSDMINYC